MEILHCLCGGVQEKWSHLLQIMTGKTCVGHPRTVIRSAEVRGGQRLGNKCLSTDR